MLTVKHQRPCGGETVYECVRVERDTPTGPIKVFQPEDRDLPGGWVEIDLTESTDGSGDRVWVMNRHGATVAHYSH